MIRRILCLVAASVALSGCVSALRPEELTPVVAAPLPQGKISWEVDNRNRLINGQKEEEVFRRRLSAHIEEFEEWYRREDRAIPFPNLLNTDLLHHDRESNTLPLKFGVRYDPRTGSYRCGGEPGPACASSKGLHDWAADPYRLVYLSIPGEAQTCEWEIDGRLEVDVCLRKETSVRVDQETKVLGRAVGATTWLDVKVKVRDLKIVAIGDSFSAGEGNPHTQWRYYTPFRKHPAYWLDARCHRSLMSGPSLTAAYLAQRNPHLSVTLLHYGCSGASVADGVAAPWSLLETDADIRTQYGVFKIKGDAFNVLEVSRMIGARDVPVSQIDQAKADLTVEGRQMQPDVVLVSVGGNDIGFATIVKGLVTTLDTHPDLKKRPIADERPYAPFDHAAWAAAARTADCVDVDRVGCMEQRVRERIGGSQTGDNGRQTLVGQYDVLAERLKELTPSDRVLITHYPNFVMREPDNADQALAPPSSAVGCSDHWLDKRADFVPGVLVVPGLLGMNRETAERAGDAFLRPLNDAISDRAKAHGWTVIDAHLENGKTHGYCSLRRYYNTLGDSYWFQGRRYQGPRPLGNVTVLKDQYRFGLPAGSQIVWNDRRACFTLYPDPDGSAACLTEPPPRRAPQPLEELKRTAKREQSYNRMVEKGSSLWTSGPVHPNLFGHCNYASAMITKIIELNRKNFEFDPQLLEDIAKAGESGGLKAEAVCSAETWGFLPHVGPWPR